MENEKEKNKETKEGWTDKETPGWKVEGENDEVDESGLARGV